MPLHKNGKKGSKVIETMQEKPLSATFKTASSGYPYKFKTGSSKKATWHGNILKSGKEDTSGV